MEEVTTAPPATIAEAVPTEVEAPAATPDLQTQEVGGTEGNSTGQVYTVKVGGEDVQVSLDEALGGYMRQADYTQKTQALAEQREQLTYAEQIAQALETNPAETISALAQAFDVASAQQAAPTEPAPATVPEPEMPLDPEEARFARIETFMQQQEMRAFEQEVQSQLNELHQQYGKFDDTAVIQYAVSHNVPDIRVAAKAYIADSVLDQARRQVAERQTQQLKAGAPPVAGGHGIASGTVQTGGATPVNSIEDAFALAEQSLAVA